MKKYVKCFTETEKMNKNKVKTLPATNNPDLYGTKFTHAKLLIQLRMVISVVLFVDNSSWSPNPFFT